MRILSTGDWHYNCGYDEDILSSVNQMIEYVKCHTVDLVAMTGDLYERASEPGSRNLAAECIQELANWVPVLIIRGNHDALFDLKILSKLNSLQRIIVHETPGELDLDNGKVLIVTMPWLTKARWQSLNPGASKEEGDRTVSQMVIEYIKGVVNLNPDKKVILVGHMTVAGALCQAHQQLGADGVTVGIYDFADAGLYAALLGHIHLKQNCGGSRYFYNGSIAALDYGEKPDKYFSVLDTDTGEVEWNRLKTVHRQDINAEWTPLGIKVDMEGISSELLEGARVRASLRVNGGDNTEQAKKQLADWLIAANVLEFQISPQVIPTSQVRAVEISNATTLSDKLRQYWIAVADPEDEVKVDLLGKLSELEDAYGNR